MVEKKGFAWIVWEAFTFFRGEKARMESKAKDREHDERFKAIETKIQKQADD
ncbi:hypothetical protein HYR99_28425 [Candidatus Poribacteria bacterium]|nr:hypothetical protein [Candidatus Poribacteria bacterium]